MPRFNIPVNANNVVGRHKTPFLESGFRFPTTKEIEQIVAEIAPNMFDNRNALLDRYFPTSTTYAHEIEMFVLRSQSGESPGMTFVHQLGSNVLPVETRASKLDLARASWSPLAFKESRMWEEKELLLLGRLTEEVQASQVDEEIANSLTWLLSRMQNRRDWMLWQVMQTGTIVIDGADTYNPNGLTYTVDFQVTDPELTLAIKFDEKDGVTGKSLIDPIEYFLDLKKAATYKPEIMPVKLIVNSGFREVLADNTFIQYLVDYERGWTAIEMRPPRSVYLAAALDVFTRYSGMPVEFYDETYVDGDGNIKHWLSHGRMIVICQNDSPLGKFVYTGHIAGMSSNGRVQVGTGPYIHVDDQTKGDPPFYKIMGGFHGLPQLTGYSVKDFSYNRIKWLDYATDTVVEDYFVDFPTDAELRPLGAPPSPTGR
jgi:hypothetical protein